MLALRSHIALLLLLCLVRTLLPEALVLSLHRHEHTTDTLAAPVASKGKPLLSAAHQHCAVEHFYDVAYQPAAPLLMPTPPPAAGPYAALLTPADVRPAVPVRAGPAAPRGPPAAIT